MQRSIVVRALVAVLAMPALVAGQAQYPTRFSSSLAERPDVAKALGYIDAHFDAQVREWMAITEIPGQSEHEQKRGAYVTAELGKIGLAATTDAIGNVIAVRKGTGGGPTIVFAAHLDTVHPLDTDVTVTRKADGTLHAPGVFDNSASVANLLQALRAMRDAGVQTRGDLILLFTAQEELGLKGMSHWLDEHPKTADMLIALDGGLGAVNYGALGIYWSRMIFSGEGAHTNNSRGQPNPARAAAQCINDIYAVPLPGPGARVEAIYNVGGIMTAGRVVNAIPQEVTFTVDLRTVDPELLGSLDAQIVGTCEQAAAAHTVRFAREYIMKSEAGGRPDQLADRRAHPLVQTAVDVLRHLGVSLPPGREALPTGSTDSNAGVVRGIPSISVGRSRGGDQHTLREWSDIESAKIGTKQIVLLSVSLAR